MLSARTERAKRILRSKVAQLLANKHILAGWNWQKKGKEGEIFLSKGKENNVIHCFSNEGSPSRNVCSFFISHNIEKALSENLILSNMSLPVQLDFPGNLCRTVFVILAMFCLFYVPTNRSYLQRD